MLPRCCSVIKEAIILCRTSKTIPPPSFYPQQPAGINHPPDVRISQLWSAIIFLTFIKHYRQRDPNTAHCVTTQPFIRIDCKWSLAFATAVKHPPGGVVVFFLEGRGRVGTVHYAV